VENYDNKGKKQLTAITASDASFQDRQTEIDRERESDASGVVHRQCMKKKKIGVN